MSAKFTPVNDNPAAAFVLPERYQKILVVAILVTAGGAMAWISWLKWPDLLIDFGEQVYVAWQVSEGKVLYRDLEYQFGPFSIYAHGLLFKVFGASILVLALFNILIIAALSCLIYILFLKISDRLTATACSLSFLTLFAFGQYGYSGNFNFVCAYNYQLPHGVALSFLILYLCSNYFQTPTQNRLAAIFMLTGVVYLTKPEVFLALVAALAGGMAAFFYTQRLTRREWMQTLSIAAGSFLAPPLLFLIYFSFHLPLSKATYFLLSPWIHIFNSSHLAIPFYGWVMGTDSIVVNGIKLLTNFSILAIVIVFLAWINRRLPQWNRSGSLVSIILSGLILGLIFKFYSEISRFEFLRPMPLIMLSLIVYSGIRLRRAGAQSPNRDFYFNLLILSIFSFVLLFKIVLNTHLYHYGFALALPATLVFIWLVLFYLPKVQTSFLGPYSFYRATFMVLLLVVITKHILLSHSIYQLKTYPVGTGTDTLLEFDPDFYSRGPILNDVLNYVETEVDPNDTIVTLPLGNIINYMARRQNHIRMQTFNPAQAILLGETRYLNELKQSSPDHIILVEVDHSLLGARYFGQDYAKESFQWIQRNYGVQKQFGEVPFSGRGFGIQILKRNDEHPN